MDLVSKIPTSGIMKPHAWCIFDRAMILDISLMPEHKHRMFFCTTSMKLRCVSEL
jgi:hypothetical protein